MYLFVFGCTLASLVTQGIGQCDSGFIRHDDRCYHFGDDTENWISALEMCERLFGAHLAEITDARENSFLQNEAKPLKADFWIGGSDLKVEGEWMWFTSTETIQYSTWNPGQPDNSKGEDCLELAKDFNIMWNDDHCSELKRYICEKPSEGIEVIG